MSTVFISYSHKDNDFAQIMFIQLETKGFSPWIDFKGLKAGDDWRKGIENVIDKSKVVVIVMSPDSMVSPYVTFEWAYAYGKGIPLLPILYKSVQLHPKLESLHYLDFTHPTNRPWNTLFDRINSL